MASTYRIPAARQRHEVVIEKSRFIADVAHAQNVDAAKGFVQSLREEFPDATHHCFAFVAGRPNDSQVMGSSDDGEPGGTAGKPMLTVLAHSGLGEIVAVVTRYYGGIKLGTGGLVRAYGGTLAQALQTLKVTEKVHFRYLRTRLDYALLPVLEHTLNEFQGRIEHAEYGADVQVRMAVPETELAHFESALRNRSQDRLRCEREDEA